MCHRVWLGPVIPFMKRLSPLSYTNCHEFILWLMCTSLCHLQTAAGVPGWQAGLGPEWAGLAELPTQLTVTLLFAGWGWSSAWSVCGSGAVHGWAPSTPSWLSWLPRDGMNCALGPTSQAAQPGLMVSLERMQFNF